MVEHAIRDQRLEELQCELERRQNMLLEKSFTLNETAKTNDLLESVASDYGKYKDFVVNEKTRQQEAMYNILEHLNRVIEEENLTTESLKHAKFQQHEILKNLAGVKNKLEHITRIKKEATPNKN